MRRGLLLALLCIELVWAAPYRVRSPDGTQAAERTATQLSLVQGVRRKPLGDIWGADGPWWTPDSRYVVWLYRTGRTIDAAAWDTRTEERLRLTDADNHFPPPHTTLVSFTPKDAIFYLDYGEDAPARQVKVRLP